jgi:hypothetical protein
MAERLEFALPMVRRGTGLYADQAWRQLLEESYDVAPLQLPADDHLTFRINAVDLENRLRDIESHCRNRLHVWLRVFALVHAGSNRRNNYGTLSTDQNDAELPVPELGLGYLPLFAIAWGTLQ